MSLTRSEAVLELGKKLVAQLETDDDLLASWMAHYVAELIEAAETARPESRDAAQDACANAILHLWQHRRSLPEHLRPLGELEPIERTLASLDVDRTDFRYSSEVLRKAAVADADEGAKQWLEVAIGIDYSARLLVQFALRLAGERAASQSEPWVELARNAGAEEDVGSLTLRFIVEHAADNDAEEDAQRTALLDKVSRLERFALSATSVARILRAELSPEGGEVE